MVPRVHPTGLHPVWCLDLRDEGSLDDITLSKVSHLACERQCPGEV